LIDSHDWQSYKMWLAEMRRKVHVTCTQVMV